MKPVEPVSTVELFPKLSRELLSVLRGLRRDDWEKPTACPLWTVKDVAAHLLGGNLGRLSDERGGPAQPEAPAMTFDELVRLIDRENSEWVAAARRISPSLLITFLELTDRRLYQDFKKRPEDEPARIPVSWAGDVRSPNWFDIAREYTEKWLHQQHIREAVGRTLLVARPWLHPVLDTFMRALPHTYRDLDAKDGTGVSFHIRGAAGGDWSLLRQGGAWLLYSGTYPEAIAFTSLDQDLAWRLFTKGISPESARPQLHVEGDQEVGLRIVRMVSLMA